MHAKLYLVIFKLIVWVFIQYLSDNNANKNWAEFK